MIWDECRADTTKVEYATCQVCKNYPALNIISKGNDDYEGPFCLQHWHEHIDKQFKNLEKRLDDENWGSSPELMCIN